MVDPDIKSRILKDLERLSPADQVRAAGLVRSLVTPPLPKGASAEDLMRFAGTLDDESAREMMEAIEEGCGKVNLEDWELDLGP